MYIKKVNLNIQIDLYIYPFQKKNKKQKSTRKLHFLLFLSCVEELPERPVLPVFSSLCQSKEPLKSRGGCTSPKCSCSGQHILSRGDNSGWGRIGQGGRCWGAWDSWDNWCGKRRWLSYSWPTFVKIVKYILLIGLFQTLYVSIKQNPAWTRLKLKTKMAQLKQN